MSVKPNLMKLAAVRYHVEWAIAQQNSDPGDVIKDVTLSDEKIVIANARNVLRIINELKNPGTLNAFGIESGWRNSDPLHYTPGHESSGLVVESGYMRNQVQYIKFTGRDVVFNPESRRISVDLTAINSQPFQQIIVGLERHMSGSPHSFRALQILSQTLGDKDAVAFLSLSKALAEVSNTKLPPEQQIFDAMVGKLKTAFEATGIVDYLKPSQLNQVVATITGHELKVFEGALGWRLAY